MTNQQTVEAAVLTALASRLKIDEADVDLDLPLHLLPKIESVVILTVMVDVENALGIVIPDDVPFEAATGRELVNLIEKLA